MEPTRLSLRASARTGCGILRPCALKFAIRIKSGKWLPTTLYFRTSFVGSLISETNPRISTSMLYLRNCMAYTLLSQHEQMPHTAAVSNLGLMARTAATI